MGFIKYNAEQPLRGTELKETEVKKTKTYRNVI